MTRITELLASNPQSKNLSIHLLMVAIVLCQEAPDKDAMLAKVRQSVGARRVVEATRVDMKSSSGFLSLRVLDEQALELIGQFDIPVVALVAWAFSQ